jgi:hypothetical protein
VSADPADRPPAAGRAHHADDAVEQLRHLRIKIRPCPPGAGDFFVNLAGTFVNRPGVPVAFAPVNAFHFCGIALAIWALLLTFIGVTREKFPTTDGAARAVGAISIILTIAAIGSGIYTGATEEEEGAEEEAALLLPG